MTTYTYEWLLVCPRHGRYFAWYVWGVERRDCPECAWEEENRK